MSSPGSAAFVIGFPGALARMTAAAIAASARTTIWLLAPAGTRDEAQVFAKTLGPDTRVVEGDVTRIDFGLRGKTYLDLAEAATAICYLTLPPAPASSHRVEQARVAAREVLELARLAPQIAHLVVLSHLDVVGTGTESFTEQDFDVGQGFPGVDQEERFRAERIFRRFVDDLPITIVRTGWICGVGENTCPLVHLLLAVADDPGKEGEWQPVLTEIGALTQVLAGIVGTPPSRGGRTLHLAGPGSRTAAQLSATARAMAAELVPVGFDLIAGARRVLRRKGLAHQWSYREFFKRQPGRARLSSDWTERFLEEQDLPWPALDDEQLAVLVEGAVEEIVGFK